jgi:hypothetical protein
VLPVPQERESEQKSATAFLLRMWGQIDRLAKHRVFKDNTFLCNACYEERKKKEDDKKKMAGEVLKSLAYVGGFAGITK